MIKRPRISSSLDTAALSLALGAAQVLVATTYALVARNSSPTSFGIAVAVLGLAAILSGVVDFGLNGYLVRELAARRVMPVQVFQRLLRRFVLLFLLCLTLVILAALLEFLTDLAILGPCFAACLVVLSNNFGQSAQVPARARGQVKVISLATLSDRLAGLLIALALISMNVSALWMLVFSVTAGQLASGAILLLATAEIRGAPRSMSRWLRGLGSPQSWVRAWQGSLHYGVAGLAGAFQQIDTTLLSVSGGLYATGIYGGVARWTQPLVLPATALSQAIAGEVASASSLRTAARAVMRSSWLLILGVIGSVTFAIASEPLTLLVLGPAYSGAGTTLSILSLAVIPTLFAQPFSLLLQSRKKDRFIGIAMWVTVTLRLVLVVLLGFSMGPEGAAVAVLAQQSLMLFLTFGAFWRQFRLERQQPCHSQ